MTPRGVIGFVLTCWLGLLGSQVHTEAAPDRPWVDLDPTDAPLNSTVDGEGEYEGVLVKQVRFHSHRAFGADVAVAALYGRLRDSNASASPGLLHIHGGGQTASVPNVVFFAKRGYAVLSFDWSGPRPDRPADSTTRLPPGITGIRSVEAGVEANQLSQLLTMSRRCLTWLAAQEEVDSTKLGVYGVSWGGLATWLLNAADSRLRAAVSLYACGSALREEGTDLWHTTFLPAHVAEEQESPVLFLGGTNEYAGRLDVLAEVVGLTSQPIRHSLVLNEMHGLNAAARRTAYRWLDHYLKGDVPKLSLPPTLTTRKQQGRHMATVVAPGAQECKLCYSFGEAEPLSRFWRWRPMVKEGGLFQAQVPTTAPAEPVLMFVNATYPERYVVSSDLTRLAASDLAGARPDAQAPDLLFRVADGPDAWTLSWLGGSVELIPAGRAFELRESTDGGRPCLAYVRDDAAAGSLRAFLRSPLCPSCPGDGAKGIQLSLNTNGLTELRIQAYEEGDHVAMQRPYEHDVSLVGAGGWREVTVGHGDLRNASGQPLQGFGTVAQIALSAAFGDGVSPEIGDIRWIR